MDIQDLLQQGYRYAFSLTHNPALAEDLVHEAWLSILNISAPHSKAYLYTTIRHKFLNQQKHNNVIPFISIDQALTEGDLVDTEANFSEVLADQQWLEKALENLKPLEREVIYLYYYEGYTTPEIAALIDHSKGVVCSLIYRARVKLKSLLENDLARVAL